MSLPWTLFSGVEKWTAREVSITVAVQIQADQRYLNKKIARFETRLDVEFHGAADLEFEFIEKAFQLAGSL